MQFEEEKSDQYIQNLAADQQPFKITHNFKQSDNPYQIESQEEIYIYEDSNIQEKEMLISS